MALHLLRPLRLPLATTAMVVGHAQKILSAIRATGMEAAAQAQPQSSVRHRLSRRVLASVARAIVRFAYRVAAVPRLMECQ